MKGRILSMGWALVALGGAWCPLTTTGTTIGRWDFNSIPADTSAATGTTAPSVGIGTASLVGGVNGTFAAGSGTDAAPDNSGWSTAGYPAASTGNKTAGVEFRVGTRGYSNIVVSWEQRLSGSASRFSRLQYSINGTDFVDGPAIDFATNNTFLARSVSLAGIVGTINNSNFAFRLVAEFQSTATGSGAAAYVTPLGTSYSGSGTVRFDLVQIDGVPMRPSNTPPTIQPIADLQTVEGQPIPGVSVEIHDDASPPAELRVQASSSNPALIPASQVVLTGTGYVRQMTITPNPGQFGEAIITLTASDVESLASSVSFAVQVTPLNAAPSISAIAAQRRVLGVSEEVVAFVVGDAETAAESLGISARSSNPALVAPSGLLLGGAGANRTLQIVPVSGATGTAEITVQVDDGGGRSSTSSFNLMVVPSTATLLWETFGYADGSLVTNSAGGWTTHGGTTGQVQVVDGGVLVSSTRTEDVHLLLPGGAVEQGILYAAFEVTFAGLPSASEYFAHFNHANGFRARVFAGTNNAARGSFRLGIGNGGNSAVGQLPIDLALNTTYTVVIRYDVSTAQSSLWINPTSESDAMAIAGDVTTSVPVQSVSLRNNAGIGSMRVTFLRVGRTFADVIRSSSGWMLNVARAGELVEVSWPAAASGYRLQSNAGTTPAGWLDEPTAPTVTGDRMIVRVPKTGAQRFFRLSR